MSHYCGVAEARGKMPCMEQCDECRAYERAESGEDELPVNDLDGLKEKDMLT